MSAVRIKVYKNTTYRTEVTVDGKFAYQTANHPTVEAANLQKLLDIMVIENIDIDVEHL